MVSGMPKPCFALKLKENGDNSSVFFDLFFVVLRRDFSEKEDGFFCFTAQPLCGDAGER